MVNASVPNRVVSIVIFGAMTRISWPVSQLTNTNCVICFNRTVVVAATDTGSIVAVASSSSSCSTISLLLLLLLENRISPSSHSTVTILMVQLLQKNHSRINCRNRRIVTLRRRLVVVRLFQWKENGGGRVGNHHRKGGAHGNTSLILFRYGRMNFQCILPTNTHSTYIPYICVYR